MQQFLQRKGIHVTGKVYFITALSYMALGLFTSLIIGLIIQTVGEQVVSIFSPSLAQIFMEMGSFAMDTKIMGGAIGVAIAYGLKAPPLVLFSALFAGAFGAELGGPAGSYVSAVLATEMGKMVYQETRVDIIITPLVTIIAGFATGKFIGPAISRLMQGFGEMINWSTEQQPFIMGILVAVLMGIALTAPISSAAIAIMLSLDGLAAGAATVGCSAQMIGFAVASYRDNGFGGFIAQGVGTSMLQVANIVKKPIILLPPTIAGAMVAPFATVWLELTNNPSGAGMGTSGFVGQIMTIESMGFSMSVLWSMLMLHMIAPAIISLLIVSFLRKKGWIQPGDMKITYE
ncbi:PTS sugar transporter subunit IIC [Virgibacillus pantothenticus]|uniref:PTS transporter subunit IIC n=1 Tax=Virgibacillus pantothenticus TaxID=1473 RepID=UPI001C213F2C|nr:PTS sugar transporter subunit IIC [Virgibacillus pantothenticus]MBU8565175.1 PTS sugar transporter subunit IIC [Virgibacillus pantothenticus]MBU8601459.1 PTS sugar transporter subunit IIC [Virgibacillus pantothenticus]MBU8633494.1 PTS sugar transporter subunit IIC [Virgibacillus pantothenticus]MBU8643412.1 PTS sugar transporter subunit IIC [Virgibacillus pantothenticus]MBU8647533.1 PTS sugar transporter subunit IIC [Virgibacillus pantothenticus]